MNVGKDKMRRNCSSAPGLEFVKLERAAETGHCSYSVSLCSFVLMSVFKNNWHGISHFIS